MGGGRAGAASYFPSASLALRARESRSESLSSQSLPHLDVLVDASALEQADEEGDRPLRRDLHFGHMSGRRFFLSPVHVFQFRQGQRGLVDAARRGGGAFQQQKKKRGRRQTKPAHLGPQGPVDRENREGPDGVDGGLDASVEQRDQGGDPTGGWGEEAGRSSFSLRRRRTKKKGDPPRRAEGHSAVTHLFRSGKRQ